MPPAADSPSASSSQAIYMIGFYIRSILTGIPAAWDIVFPGMYADNIKSIRLINTLFPLRRQWLCCGRLLYIPFALLGAVVYPKLHGYKEEEQYQLLDIRKNGEAKQHLYSARYDDQYGEEKSSISTSWGD